MPIRFALSMLLVAGLAASARAQAWGDLEADFFLKGDFKPAKIDPDKDREFCGKHGLVRENVVVDPKTKAIANVAVYLFLPQGSQKPAIHPDYEKTAKDTVLLDNKNCRFEPHVFALRTSQKLVVGNSDPFGHNTKVEFFNNPGFNDLIPGGGKGPAKEFANPESGFAKAECSIHGWMNAWLMVRDDPYIGISDKKGHVSIKNLPVGEWTFTVWQENAGYLSDVSVNGKATKWTRGRVKVNIKPGVNKLGKIEVTPAALKVK